MGEPAPTDRDAAAGAERDRDQGPDIAVFDEAQAQSTPSPAPERSDPESHDIYRRPDSAIPFRRPPAEQPAPTPPLGPKPPQFVPAPRTAPGSPVGYPDAGGPAPAADASAEDTELAGWSTRPMEPDPADQYGGQYGSEQYIADPYAADPYPGTGHLGPDDHLAPGDFAAAHPGYDDEPYDAGGVVPMITPPEERLSLTDEMLMPRFDTDPELTMPITAPPGGAGHPVSPAGGRPERRVFGLGVGMLAAVVALLALAGTGIAVAVIELRSDNAPSTAAGAPSPELQPSGGALGAQPQEPPVGAGPSAPAESASAEPAAPAPDPAAAHAISGPLDGRRTASFDLVNGTSTINLHTDDLGEDLYRVSTPVGSSVVPQARAEGDRVQLFLVRSGEKGAGAVDIALNSRVRWDLRVTGGAEQSVIDLSSGNVSSVDLIGGATRLDLTLPRPDGTLPVRMTGGINQFIVHTADRIPVRVRMGSGAGQVVLDGRTHNGIAPGKLFTPSRWERSSDRIDLDAVAGVATLKLDRT